MSARGTWARAPLSRRLLSRYVVDEGTGCWLWTGGTNAEGYGLILPNGSDRPVRAHRIMYALFVDPDVHAELTIDHTCHNADPTCPGGRACQHRRCINPEHLEAVPRGENVRRGYARRETCRNGHVRTPENTYVRPDGRIECRPCYRDARKAA